MNMDSLSASAADNQRSVRNRLPSRKVAENNYDETLSEMNLLINDEIFECDNPVILKNHAKMLKSAYYKYLNCVQQLIQLSNSTAEQVNLLREKKNMKMEVDSMIVVLNNLVKTVNDTSDTISLIHSEISMNSNSTIEKIEHQNMVESFVKNLKIPPHDDLETSCDDLESLHEVNQDILHLPAQDRAQYQPTQDRAQFQPAQDRAQFQPAQDRAQYQPTQGQTQFQPAQDRAQFQPAQDRAQYQPAQDRAQFQPAQDRAQYQPAQDRAQFQPAQDRAQFQPAQDRAQFQPAQDRAQFQTTQDRAQFQPAQDRAQFQPVQDRAQFQTTQDTAQFQPAQDKAKFHPAQDQMQHYLLNPDREHLQNYAPTNSVPYDRNYISSRNVIIPNTNTHNLNNVFQYQDCPNVNPLVMVGRPLNFPNHTNNNFVCNQTQDTVGLHLIKQELFKVPAKPFGGDPNEYLSWLPSFENKTRGLN